jgi:hypothetical protein
MEFLTDSSLFVFGGLGDFVRLFLDSFTFSLLKFLLGIYAVVLLADIVLLLVQRGVGGDLRDTKIGMNVPKELTTKKGILQVKWEKIRKRMKSKNESDYKVSIIEADNIIDDLIKRMGYKGENMTERLDGINPGQVENIEDLKKAHEIRNRIIHDESFKLNKEEAEKTLSYFEEFLSYHEVIK